MRHIFQQRMVLGLVKDNHKVANMRFMIPLEVPYLRYNSMEGELPFKWQQNTSQDFQLCAMIMDFLWRVAN